MILCVDIGNTNVGWGVFEGEPLKASWRAATSREKMGDEWGLEALLFFERFHLNPQNVKAVVISNVVPPLTLPFEEMGKRYFNCKPLFVGETLQIPMPVLTDHPKEVGADLLVGAFEAHKKYGGPLIVVDFGTATTFSGVSRKGEFIGTAIAPGIAISAEALFSKAAKLPRIQFLKPPNAVGKNTIHSMQSGFLYGVVGQVEKIISKMKEELGKETRVIATGGLADVVSVETKEFLCVNQNLILEGLRRVYDESSNI